ncbi:MAG: GTP-binding protein [Erysipelotrichales bacterium]|nr:GTP-binding protein [Erysipelotrichales bacterium]
MSKINVISGFLGAGKTTLIKKLLSEAYGGEKVVLIENEFGEIGIDGGFLKDAGIEITEMNSGCICCSLTGDFKEALKKVQHEFTPDRILIEPSGVGKLSDVLKAVEACAEDDMHIGCGVAVVDGLKYSMYAKNFGEFFNDQVENATVVVLSRTQRMSDKEINDLVSTIKEQNPEATIITTPWDELEGKRIAEVLDAKNIDIDLDVHEHHHHHEEGECCCGHHHHDEECELDHHQHEEGECCCGHHHHDEECEHDHHQHEEGECCCGHHHHDEECEHDHHHHEEGECCCGHHHHHHGHDADEIFTSVGFETAKSFTHEELINILDILSDSDDFGVVLRAKGIVSGTEGKWYYFDMVPEEFEIREGAADFTGRIVVIGAGIEEDKIKSLFNN